MAAGPAAFCRGAEAFMAVSNVSQLIVPAVLSNYAIEFQPEGFIGDKLLSKVKVSKPAGIFRIRTKENMLRILDGAVGETGKPGELGLGYSQGKFATSDYAFETLVPIATAQAADDVIDLEMDAIRQLKVSIRIAEENRVMKLVTNAANYDANVKAALAGTAQWSDYTNSDPLPVITNLMRKMWRSPTTKLVCWMGSDVWEALRHHPKVLNRIGLSAGGTTALPAVAAFEDFARLIGVDEVYVANGRYTPTNPGQLASYSYLWGKNFGITAVERNPTTMSLSFGSQFVWVDSEITAWTNPEPGLRGALVYKIAQSADERLIINEAAILISTAVALWLTTTGRDSRSCRDSRSRRGTRNRRATQRLTPTNRWSPRTTCDGKPRSLSP